MYKRQVIWEPTTYPNLALLPPLNVELEFDVELAAFKVTWDASDEQSAEATFWEIEHRLNDGDWVGAGTMPISETEFVRFGEIGRNTHTFRVRAKGSVGNFSAWVETASQNLNILDRPFSTIYNIPLGGCPDDSFGQEGDRIYDETNKILYRKGKYVWVERIGAGFAGILTRFADTSPTLTSTTLTIDAPNDETARVPDSALALPPGYVDNIVATLALSLIHI